MLRRRQRRRRSFAVPSCDGKFNPVRNAARFSARAFRAPCLDFCADPVKRPFRLFAPEGALPDDNQIPSGVAPRLFVATVAFDVFRPLRHPECDIRLRHGRILAPVPVPEASAHVNDSLCLWNNNVGPALKPSVARSEPPAAGEKPLPDDDFRQCVSAVYLRHQPAALFWSDRIHLNAGRLLFRQSDIFAFKPRRDRRHPCTTAIILGLHPCRIVSPHPRFVAVPPYPPRPPAALPPCAECRKTLYKILAQIRIGPLPELSPANAPDPKPDGKNHFQRIVNNIVPLAIGDSC